MQVKKQTEAVASAPVVSVDVVLSASFAVAPDTIATAGTVLGTLTLSPQKNKDGKPEYPSLSAIEGAFRSSRAKLVIP